MTKNIYVVIVNDRVLRGFESLEKAENYRLEQRKRDRTNSNISYYYEIDMILVEMD